MRELICLHTGQAGVQLSSAVWELLSAEHGISSHGISDNSISEDTCTHTFFQQLPSGHFIPRAISIDLEPSVLDELRSGPSRNLFHPDQLISGLEDASNNFARGHYTLGKNIIQYTVNKIRKVLDMCESFQGFYLFHSYGGGTGSGFGSLLLERLYTEFSKQNVIQVATFPSDKLSMATVEPYNSALCTTFCIETSDLCTYFDNESLYNICNSKLEIPQPTYTNLNRVISQIYSSMTISFRFHCSLNMNIDQLVTNLVPFPRIHFPILTHTPILSERKNALQRMSMEELTKSAFDPSNQLINVVLSKGKYISCCLQYRGNVAIKEVNDSLFDIKQKVKMNFVNWSPRGFKLVINSQNPVYIPRSGIAKTDRSVTVLTNSSAISQKFLTILQKYYKLFRKRSFIHWYVGEGMEEMEFKKVGEELNVIISDYEELSADDSEEDSDSDIIDYQTNKSIKNSAESENYKVFDKGTDKEKNERNIALKKEESDIQKQIDNTKTDSQLILSIESDKIKKSFGFHINI